MTLSIQYYPLDMIQEWTWDDNPKTHSVDTIKASMMRFGFAQPMGRGDNGLFYAGHGRIKALLELRQEAPDNPPAHIELSDDGWMAPVIEGMTFKDHATYMAYVIADNETTILGGWDLETLNDQLQEIERLTGDLTGTGFTMDKIDKMLADASVDVTPPDIELPPQEEGPRARAESVILPFELTPPDHGVEYGDIWQLNCEDLQHLIVVRVLHEHWHWSDLLDENYILIHAPTPDFILSPIAQGNNILAISPDVMSVSHIIGRWIAIHGHGSAVKL